MQWRQVVVPSGLYDIYMPSIVPEKIKVVLTTLSRIQRKNGTAELYALSETEGLLLRGKEFRFDFAVAFDVQCLENTPDCVSYSRLINRY